MHALGKAPHAALHLGNHAAGNDTLVHQLPGGADVQLGVLGGDVVLVLQHARHVCHQDQLLRLQCRRQLAGGNVGVDVEGVALRGGGHGGQHGDVAVLHQRLDEGGVHPRHLPHEPDVLLHHLPRLQNIRVLSTESHRAAAGLLYESDEALVHAAGQHHLYHLHCCRICDPQPVFELCFDAQLAQPRVDLRTATVNEHRPDAHARQQHQVSNYPGLQCWILHGCSSVLDYNRLSLKFLQVWQRLRQDADPFES
mmetsp:Transcript_789/g.2421  ORF Transcript_789/g.2421 Transcript_789/m.2421 type:complete len:253 (+) Transcript_789:1121-1879(+)